jgi:hypothetical protein
MTHLLRYLLDITPSLIYSNLQDIYNQQQDETVYMFSSRNGRTYYRFQSNNNGFHRQFHQSYQVHPTNGWLGVIIQLLLMSPLTSILIIVMLCVTCCSSGGATSKNTSTLPTISPEALLEHPNHISIIIDSHYLELVTARIRRHFIRDKIHFYQSSESIEPNILVAVRHAGKKWCGITENQLMSSVYDSEYTIINWITSVINGEIKYNTDDNFVVNGSR